MSGLPIDLGQSVMVSVIIPTYQREEVLCNTICDLLRQDYRFFEIIVVDQSEYHDKETLNFIELHSGQIKYFQIDKPGLPGARNFGISKAVGDIVLFVDDDVELPSDFISNHTRNYEEKTICGVSGRIIQNGIRVVDTHQVGRVTNLGKVVGNRTSNIRTNVEWAAGGNASFRRDLVIQVGGFDSRFTGNSLFEDVDFSFRIRRLGYKLVYDPDAVIVHLASPRGGCQTRADNKLNYNYWFLRNKTLFFIENYSLKKLPLLLLTNFLRALRIGLVREKSLSGLYYLIRAIWDGYKAYRSPFGTQFEKTDYVNY